MNKDPNTAIFQLLTAIYLVAEWVSLEKIGSYYQNKSRYTFRYRLKSNRKYSPLIDDIYEEFEDKEWTIHHSRQVGENEKIQINMFGVFRA